jgi:hypothetical protein
MLLLCYADVTRIQAGNDLSGASEAGIALTMSACARSALYSRHCHRALSKYTCAHNIHGARTCWWYHSWQPQPRTPTKPTLVPMCCLSMCMAHRIYLDFCQAHARSLVAHQATLFLESQLPAAPGPTCSPATKSSSACDTPCLSRTYCTYCWNNCTGAAGCTGGF